MIIKLNKDIHVHITQWKSYLQVKGYPVNSIIRHRFTDFNHTIKPADLLKLNGLPLKQELRILKLLAHINVKEAILPLNRKIREIIQKNQLKKINFLMKYNYLHYLDEAPAYKIIIDAYKQNKLPYLLGYLKNQKIPLNLQKEPIPGIYYSEITQIRIPTYLYPEEKSKVTLELTLDPKTLRIEARNQERTFGILLKHHYKPIKALLERKRLYRTVLGLDLQQYGIVNRINDISPNFHTHPITIEVLKNELEWRPKTIYPEDFMAY